MSQSFEDMRYCVFWINQYPEILCNSVFQLDFDFTGKQLQDWTDVNNELDAISVSFITTFKGGAIVLAWHKSADSTCISFVQSLLTFSDKRKPNLLVNWAVKEIENIFFAPVWWESLHPINQQIVIENFRQPFTSSSENFYISNKR